jgi:hypothetical protein
LIKQSGFNHYGIGLTSVEYLDLASNEWRENIAPLPIGRGFLHSFEIASGYIALGGGSAKKSDDPTMTMDLFDITNNCYSRLPYRLPFKIGDEGALLFVDDGSVLCRSFPQFWVMNVSFDPIRRMLASSHRYNDRDRQSSW